MNYEISISNYKVTLTLDLQFGDEEFLINGYKIKKLLQNYDFTNAAGDVGQHKFSENIYPDFIEMYDKEIMEELDDNALEISKLYREYQKENAVEAR